MVAREAEPRGLRFLLVKTFCMRWQLLSAPSEPRSCWPHTDEVIRTYRGHMARWLLGGYNGQEARVSHGPHGRLADFSADTSEWGSCCLGVGGWELICASLVLRLFQTGVAGRWRPRAE